MGGVIVRDHVVDDPLDRIEELEKKVAQLERALASVVIVESAGSIGATEQAYFLVIDGDGNTGYLHVFAAK